MINRIKRFRIVALASAAALATLASAAARADIFAATCVHGAVEGDVVRELGESQVLRIGKNGFPTGGTR